MHFTKMHGLGNNVLRIRVWERGSGVTLACSKGYFRFSAFGDPDDTKEAADRLCKLLGR